MGRGVHYTTIGGTVVSSVVHCSDGVVVVHWWYSAAMVQYSTEMVHWSTVQFNGSGGRLIPFSLIL